MNASTRFLRLLGVLLTGSPTLWIYPIALSAFGSLSILIGGMSLTSHSGHDYNGWVFVMLMAGNLFGVRGLQKQTFVFSDPEFLLTRAISRDDLFRATVMAYWALILLPTATFFLSAAWSPASTFWCSKESVESFLPYLSGAHVAQYEKDEVSLAVPYGTFLVAGWKVAILFAVALLTQLFAVLALRMGSAWWVLVPGILVLVTANYGVTDISTFLVTISHGVALGGVFALLFLLTYWLCRAIYRRQEF